MTDQARDLKIAAAALSEFLGKGKEFKTGGDNHQTCCPAHEDNNPSLGIFVDEQIRLKCYAGCEDADIRQAIDKLGFKIPTFKANKKAQNSNDWTINKYAHEDRPSDEWFLSNLERIPDHIYTYTDDQGRPLTLVVRFDAKPPAGKKEIKQLSSAKSKLNGVDFWVKRAYADKLRPLYGLQDLADRPNTKVLLVEGEKAADAAAYMLPEYVVLTWSGGANAVNKTNFGPLVNREVTLWPDNDVAGVKAMKEIASILSRGSKKANSVRMVFPEANNDYPEGFDLADEYDTGYPPLEDQLADASLVDLSDLPDMALALDDEEILAKIKALSERYAAMENGAEILYVDTQSASPHNAKLFPYSVYSKGSLEQKEVETYLDITSKSQKKNKVVSLFFDNPKKVWLHGYTYDPSTNDSFVRVGNQVKLNLYVGLANPPKQCDEFRFDSFVKHIKASLKPEEADYLLDWLAAVIQFPNIMIGTMVVLAGRQGCGKTIVCDIMRAMLGRHNSVKIGMSELTSAFNSQYANKLFIDVEEYNPGNTKIMRDLREKVKNLVTSESMVVNTKGIPAFENPAYHSVIATTNSLSPEAISFDNRRMTFLNFDNQELLMDGRIIRDPNYFAPLYKLRDSPDALSGLCHWLMARKVDINRVMRPLETEVAEDAMEFIDNPVYDFLKQLAETGALPDWEELPDDTNPFPLSQWPKCAAAMPRRIMSGMFYAFCQEKFNNMSREKAARIILRTLMRTKRVKGRSAIYKLPRGISHDFNIDTTRPSWSVKRTRDGSTTSFADRSICLPDIDELRAMVEAMAGTAISWSEFAKGDTVGDTVVIFPRKPQGDEDF